MIFLTPLADIYACFKIYLIYWYNFFNKTSYLKSFYLYSKLILIQECLDIYKIKILSKMLF